MSRVLRAWVFAICFGCVAAWLAIPVARADAELPVAMSDLKSTHTTIDGVLTFRSADVVNVDQGSVKATIDNREATVSVQKSTHLARTAMLVIDTSGSMGTNGMAIVRAATATYLREAPADVKVGVVTFSNTAGVDVPPTQNRPAVQRVVNGLVARGDTSLYAAIQSAATALGSAGDRSIVLLSDGADTVSKNPSSDLSKATQALKDHEIRVDVIRFNTDDPAASKALAQFAGAAGGSVIAAKDATAVGAAFQKAARALQSQAQFEVSIPSGVTGAQHQLVITGTAGGKPFSVTQSVTLSGADVPATTTRPSASPAAAPSLKAPAVHEARTLPWIAIAVVGLGIGLLTWAVLNPNFQSPRERRLASVEGYVTLSARTTREAVEKKSTSAVEQLSLLADRLTKGRKWTDKTMELINRADLPFRAGEWALLRGAAVIIGVAGGMVLFADAKPVGAMLGLVVGAALPAVFLRLKASRRAGAFEKLLPQALLLASTSLRSGFSLNQALESVASDSPQPVGKELSRALAESRIGADIADALDHVSERMGTESMKMAVMAIRIQREVGGNLAETLETTARTLRERESLKGQIKALSAEGRLSAYILIALPIGIFFYMTMVNYSYVSLLWTTAVGLMMSIGAVVLMVLGIFWMRKTVQIEV